jgi:hypothetical protein
MDIEVGSFIYDAMELMRTALKIKPDRNETIKDSTEILKTTNIHTMETINFFSSVAALNITSNLQITIRKGAENNWIISVIFQSIATAFLSS